MSLIKLAPGIESIKGRFAGQVFTNDSSGQHLNTLPRNIKKPATEKQRDQRNWYSSKKYAEKYPFENPEFPKDEIPPGTHVIYSLDWIGAHRQPSLTAPEKTVCDATGFWPDEIVKWINIVWNPQWAAWGLTKQLMFWMSLKWFYVYKYTHGMSSAVAFTGSKTMMMHWISTSAAAVAVPLLSLWGGLIGLTFYFKFLSWLDGYSGTVSFTTGRVLIRKDTTIWWGGLSCRPSEKMYDFTVCGLAPFDGTIHKVIPAAYPYKINFFHFDELWQTVSSRLLWYYVYTWQQCRCRFRGMGYRIGGNRLRMRVSESQHDFWQKPVGWYQVGSDACAYLGQFDDYFSYHGRPAPPL